VDEEYRPALAFALSLFAGLLMLVDGIYLFAVANAATVAGFATASSLIGVVAFLGVFFGFIVIILAVLLYRNPEAHTGYGIAILVLSLLSIFGGGGFLLGLVLGAIAGIFAILFEPDPWESSFVPVPSTTSPRSVTFVRACTMCGVPIPAGMSSCPKCGWPAPRS
jgi:hypothetical protein